MRDTRVHRIQFELRRIARMPPPLLAQKAVLKLIGLTVWFILLPATTLLHLAGYRRVTVFTDRIGHLALEPDCLLKEQTLGIIPKKRWFILAPPGRVANLHLLGYWEPHIQVYKGRVACYILANMSHFGLMRYDISHYILSIDEPHAAYRIYAQWGSRPPLLALTEGDIEWSGKALQELGVPEGAWFVCVHVREPGFSPADEELHAHRNANIKNIIPAIQEITRRNGWVVRIGDTTMAPLPQMPQVIDYAHHPMKSERLDIILCAKARFILGNTSGIALVGSVFGVPCALVNMIPMSTLGLLSSDISIPKLCWSMTKEHYLSFNGIMGSPISNYRYASLFSKDSIRVDENSEEDIHDLVVEMLDRLDGQFIETEDDHKLQQHYLSLFHPGHYSYGASSHVGTMFLRRHHNLLTTTNDVAHSKSGGTNNGPTMIT